jgi:hypothetical protein
MSTSRGSALPRLRLFLLTAAALPVAFCAARCLAADLTAGPAASGPDNVAAPRDEHAQSVCGRNALYIYLRLQACPVSYDQVAREVQIDERGTSLQALHNAARRLGFAAQVRRLTMEELANSSLPVIAHLGRSVVTGDTGHYIVVLRVEEDGVTFLDGTTGETIRYARDRFPNHWTGYVLDRQSPWRNALLAAAAVACGILTVLAVLCLRPGRLISGRSGRQCEIGVAILLIITTATPPTPAAEVTRIDEAGVWRGPASNGPNALYVFLRVFNWDVSLETARKAVNQAGGDVSLITLRDATRQLGLPTRVVKCGPAEFATLRLPAIVRLTDIRCRGGRFVLVYHCGEKSVGILDGSTALLTEVSMDDFRRSWSGHALVADTRRSQDSLVAAAGGAGLVLAYWIVRKYLRTRQTGKPDLAIAHTNIVLAESPPPE